jgi:hypothetical protein
MNSKHICDHAMIAPIVGTRACDEPPAGQIQIVLTNRFDPEKLQDSSASPLRGEASE